MWNVKICHENVSMIYSMSSRKLSAVPPLWLYFLGKYDPGETDLNNKLCPSSGGNDITSLHYFNVKNTKTQKVRYEEQVYTSVSLSTVNRSCLLSVLSIYAGPVCMWGFVVMGGFCELKCLAQCSYTLKPAVLWGVMSGAALFPLSAQMQKCSSHCV